ncbi:MAG: hypothetical protein JWN34_2284 [Bryobacterales bacterium]|jgi:hypothetical protein|nr:hypothetical protein [Bryobacterales bacterium]
MDSPRPLQEAIIYFYFADFDTCQKFTIKLRWADGKVKCPQYGSDRVVYLEAQKRWTCYGSTPTRRSL